MHVRTSACFSSVSCYYKDRRGDLLTSLKLSKEYTSSKIFCYICAEYAQERTLSDWSVDPEMSPNRSFPMVFPQQVMKKNNVYGEKSLIK